MIIEIKGSNGALQVYDDRVVISRSSAMGRMAQGFTGDRTIFYSDISSVEYRRPTFFANGYLRFILPGTLTGRKATKGSIVGGVTSMAGLKDQNTITLRAFSRERVKAYQRAYEVVMEKLGESKSRTPQAQKDPTRVYQLAKLAELRQSGVLTESEFEAEKKRILSQ